MRLLFASPTQVYTVCALVPKRSVPCGFLQFVGVIARTTKRDAVFLIYRSFDIDSWNATACEVVNTRRTYRGGGFLCLVGVSQNTRQTRRRLSIYACCSIPVCYTRGWWNATASCQSLLAALFWHVWPHDLEAPPPPLALSYAWEYVAVPATNCSGEYRVPAGRVRYRIFGWSLSS